jgi:hypothetical protein
MRKEAPVPDPHAGGVVPVRVFVARNVTEAELAVVFLGEKGIPARVENPLSHMTLSVLEPVLDGAEGVSVVVASDRSAEATAALEEFRRPLRGAPGPGEDDEGE